MNTIVSPVRLLVADDHPLVLRGMIAILSGRRDIKVIATATDGAEAVRSFQQHRPDVSAIDLRMPGASGMEALEQILAIDTDARVLILTTFDTEEDVFRALTRGARGYVLKDAPPEEIVSAILRVNAGQRYIPATISSRLAERMDSMVLTPREVQVLTLVARGDKNKQIARHLCTTEGTVKSYVNSIMLKLGARDRTEAVTISLRRGILTLEQI